MKRIEKNIILEWDSYGEYSFEIVEVIKKDVAIYIVIVGKKDCCVYNKNNYFFEDLEDAEKYVKEFKEEIDAEYEEYDDDEDEDDEPDIVDLSH